MPKANNSDNSDIILRNVRCPLERALTQLDPGSIQLAREIQRDGSYSFITGDGCVYAIEDKKPVLYLTNAALNPVLKQENIAAAAYQISQFGNGNYRIKDDDFLKIINAAGNDAGAKRYPLSDLDLAFSDDDKWSYFDIETQSPEKLNKLQKELAEQVHGKGVWFGRVMDGMNNELISRTRIDETRINIFSPDYVLEAADGGPMAAVGFLDCFGGKSCFDIGSNDINCNMIYVRGKLRL